MENRLRVIAVNQEDGNYESPLQGYEVPYQSKVDFLRQVLMPNLDKSAEVKDIQIEQDGVMTRAVEVISTAELYKVQNAVRSMQLSIIEK